MPMPSDGVRGDGATEVRETYKKMLREAADAGREVPREPVYLDQVPAYARDWVHDGVAASMELSRDARARTFGVSIDLKAMEAARRAREARLAAQLAEIDRRLTERLESEKSD